MIYKRKSTNIKVVKKLLILSIVSVLAMVFFGCAGRVARDADPPEIVVSKFFNSLRGGNTEAAYSLLSENVTSKVDLKGFAIATDFFADYSDMVETIMKNGINPAAAEIYAKTFHEATHYRTELLTIDGKVAMVGYALFAPDVEKETSSTALLFQYFIQLAKVGSDNAKLDKTIREYWAVLPKTQQNETDFIKLELENGYWRVGGDWAD